MPFNSPALQKLVVIAKGPKTQQLETGMAQRQRAVSLCGLITPRSLDRDELPVYHPLVALQKLLLVVTTFKQLYIAQRQNRIGVNGSTRGT